MAAFKSLKQILHETHGIPEATLDEIYQTSRDNHENVGYILIHKKLLTEVELLETMSQLYGIPFGPDLPLENFSTEYTQTIPIQFLKKYLTVPLVMISGDEKPPDATDAS